MTHRSFKNEQPTIHQDNQRLEFLGDAILTAISAEYLYDRYPQWSERDLTEGRKVLVDQTQLCQFAQQLKLGQAMQLGQGEQKQNGHRKPKLLCDAFEAMIGAYFLDTGRNMQAVSDYVKPLFKTVDVATALKTTSKNYKSPLQEFVQQNFDGALPDYIEISCSGPDHQKCYEMEVHIGGKAYGRGAGNSKSQAEQAAAKSTLQLLGALTHQA